MASTPDTVVLDPFGIPMGRHARETPLPDTEPISLPPEPPQTDIEYGPMPVKVSETCGVCGSSLSLEWGGRVDALRVLRDWRGTHRCQPEVGTGSKGSLIERAPGFGPED